MSASKGEYAAALKELASLMVGVAGESVTVVKRSVPDQAMKLKPKQEWDLYLEFLMMLFNLADRVSALHVPLKDQPVFMDSLEDEVTARLKGVLAPALGPQTDDMEVTLTIGRTVAESRTHYDQFKFFISEESPAKQAFLKHLAERIVTAFGASGNGMVASAATLCATSAVEAINALFDNLLGTHRPGTDRRTEPVPTVGGHPSSAASPISNEIKLLVAQSTITGEEVETRWGLHPRFRQDLTADEHRELTRLMNRATKILGERYAAVAFTPAWTAGDKVGNA